MSMDLQTFDELLRAREGFAGTHTPLTAVILGDCTFTTPWATGDNRIDLEEFARRMNLSRVETLDVAGSPTLRVDITTPLPPALESTFDIVLDIGTLYWCFDVAAGWRNCLALLKPRGLIVHHSAMTGYFGRGYYTFQPRLFRDVYRSNGFREIIVKTRARKFFEESNLLRRVLLRLAPPSLAFLEVGPDDIFVNAAGWRGLRFGRAVNPEAPMLPNDSEILCIASRDWARSFVPPRLSSGGA